MRQAEPIAPRPRGGEVPLSLAQERLWFLSRLDPDDASFNLFLVHRLRGDLDAEALKRALGEVVARHEILRTRYPATPDGRPVQVVEPAWRAGLERIDLAGLAPDERERLARELVAERVNAPFDLADRPPFRASLLRLDATDHVLCLVLHYVAGDGWSVGVLWQELAALYAASLAGEPSPLEPLAVQYADYAAWQRRRLEDGAGEAHLAYWRERLANAPALDLPSDRARPAVRTSRGEGVTRRVPLGAAVDRLARERRCTAFMVLLSAYQALLGRAAGQDDVCVGSPTAGRDWLELEPLIGLFLNTLVLRGDLSGDPTFAELLQRTRARALEAYAHQDVPFERLMTELRVRRHPGRTPLFQALFTLENPDAAGLALAGVAVETFEATYRQARFDLALEVWRDGPELVCILGYRSDLFEAATAERLAAGYEALLREALADPDARLSTLFARALSQDERRLLAAWAEGPDADTPGDSLVRLFEERAASRPDAVAISAEGEEVTYGELNRRANRLAWALRRRGVGAETRVAVVARRSPALIVALLGVLKAGGAYVPLDPAHPEERCAAILRDSGAALVLDGDRPDATGERDDDPPPAAGPDALAYVIYTSGSTGGPKGVLVTRAALLARVRWMRDAYELGDGDRVLQLASATFDTHAEEVFPCLLAGATLVLGPPAGELPDFLAGERGSRLTVMDLSTPHWHELVAAARPRWPHGLRLLVLGADQVRPDALAAWWDAAGDRVRVLNTYGPTEATIVATAATLRPGDPGPRPPIGRPIASTRAHVLDRWLAPAGVGAPGELCLGGAGLARGYLGRPGHTAERFVPDPHGPAGARLYRTGDRARWRPDGQLEFLGRLDDQVKIRGHRVEPAEVEAALLAHPAVRQAAVVAREAAGDRRLVAYVVGAAGDLRRHLAARLPEPMIPSAIVGLDRLPLTPGGKLDRRALPEPAGGPAPERPYVAPEGAAEELVARIWAEVLGVDRVGALDDFFERGGHSLLATRVAARLRAAVDLDVPLRTLFAARTVAELAAAVEELLVAEIAQLSDEEAERLAARPGA